MKVAHQNVPVSDLPGVSRGWFGSAPAAPAPAPGAPAGTPVSQDRLAPSDRLAPAAVVSNSNVRPQADHGLDGWFLDRLFGRR